MNGVDAQLMNKRMTTWLAWLLFGLFILCLLLAEFFSIVNGTITSQNSTDSPIFSFLVLAFIGFALVGVLVASHQPSNPIGWLLAGTALFLVLGAPAEEYARRALLIAPGTLPGGLTAAWLAELSQ